MELFRPSSPLRHQVVFLLVNTNAIHFLLSISFLKLSSISYLLWDCPSLLRSLVRFFPHRHYSLIPQTWGKKVVVTWDLLKSRHLNISSERPLSLSQFSHSLPLRPFYVYFTRRTPVVSISVWTRFRTKKTV